MCEDKEHLPGDTQANDWRYWFPLICMFTVARAGEVAQLRVENIEQEFGIWMFKIREDDQTNQHVKNHQNRVVAMHSKLIEIGF